MKNFQRLLVCLLCLCLAAPAALAEKAGYQDAHRFTLKKVESKRPNGAQVHRWQISTSNKAVTEELNSLAQDVTEALQGDLPRPGSNSNENSRLTVSIIPSRTGLTWMSFMVQSRIEVKQVTQDVRFTTRTYDMTTGEAVTLADIFPEDSPAWDLMANAIREGVNGYYSSLAPNGAQLEMACDRNFIRDMDFSLHGMSLVLHLDAAYFYPGKHQVIQVPLYYPEIRSMMSEKAQLETDNAAYYKTIALTLDDGPNGWITDRILQELMMAGERATYFLVGERMRQQAFYVTREHDEGHSVGTHNYIHEYANVTAIDRLQNLRDRANEVHREVLGYEPRVARAPGGHWARMAEANVGWPLIQWTVEASDWSGDNGPDPNRTIRNICGGATDGGIILMHDLKRNSIEAVKGILKRLQDEGYIFLTVEELFAKDGVTLEPNTAYWCCENGVTTRETAE